MLAESARLVGRDRPRPPAAVPALPSPSGPAPVPAMAAKYPPPPPHGSIPGASRYTCHICMRPFGSSSHLSRHRKSVHSESRDFPCRLGCGSRFNRGDNRKMHERKCALGAGREV
ncbi:hypothetical protein DFJ74DRAFT_673617 [Hyaloraphidium curvatum]|nr:hypothetical protein DFJ74DRAFT_673617 [Hyaloraphidium curvatum]